MPLSIQLSSSLIHAHPGNPQIHNPIIDLGVGVGVRISTRTSRKSSRKAVNSISPIRSGVVMFACDTKRETCGYRTAQDLYVGGLFFDVAFLHVSLILLICFLSPQQITAHQDTQCLRKLIPICFLNFMM